MADNNHKQPTKEELAAKEEEAIKLAEELEGRQQIPQDEEESKEVENEDTTMDNSESQEGEEEETTTPETEEETDKKPVEEEQAEPSKEIYKNKFSESSREAQKLAAKNRIINKALADAEDVPEPTEEELVQEFSEWDIMSDVEKTLAKETVVSRRWRKLISEAKATATKIEKWNESVENFIDSPETLSANPALEGKQNEFKEFAQQESNNSVPFPILVSAFLHDHATGKQPNKGRMFERGSGGPNDKPQPKSDKLTLEEGRRLRETNYELWKEKLAAGKIEFDL